MTKCGVERYDEMPDRVVGFDVESFRAELKSLRDGGEAGSDREKEVIRWLDTARGFFDVQQEKNNGENKWK